MFEMQTFRRGHCLGNIFQVNGSLRSGIIALTFVALCTLFNVCWSQTDPWEEFYEQRDVELYEVHGMKIHVYVNDSYPYDKSDTSLFKATIAAQLRRNDITVYEDGDNIRSDSVWKNVVTLCLLINAAQTTFEDGRLTGYICYSISLEVSDDVQLSRYKKSKRWEKIKELPKVVASIWQTSGFGSNSNDDGRSKFKERIGEYVDVFIDAYMTQNSEGTKAWVRRHQFLSDSLFGGH